MIDKNIKGNLKKIKLDKISETTNTEKINKIIKRQREIEETLNFILEQIQNGVGRINKY